MGLSGHNLIVSRGRSVNCEEIIYSYILVYSDISVQAIFIECLLAAKLCTGDWGYIKDDQYTIPNLKEHIV